MELAQVKPWIKECAICYCIEKGPPPGQPEMVAL